MEQDLNVSKNTNTLAKEKIAEQKKGVSAVCEKKKKLTTSAPSKQRKYPNFEKPKLQREITLLLGKSSVSAKVKRKRKGKTQMQRQGNDKIQVGYKDQL